MQKQNSCLNILEGIPLQQKTPFLITNMLCSQDKQQIAIFISDVIIVYLFINGQWIAHFQQKWNPKQIPICFNNNQQNQILMYDFSTQCIQCFNFNNIIFGQEGNVKNELFQKFLFNLVQDNLNHQIFQISSSNRCYCQRNLKGQKILIYEKTSILDKTYYGSFFTKIYDINYIYCLTERSCRSKRNAIVQNYYDAMWFMVNCLLFLNFKNMKVRKIFFFHKDIDFDYLKFEGHVLQTCEIEKLNDCGNIALVFQLSENVSINELQESDNQFYQLILFNLITLKIIKKIKIPKVKELNGSKNFSLKEDSAFLINKLQTQKHQNKKKLHKMMVGKLIIGAKTYQLQKNIKNISIGYLNEINHYQIFYLKFQPQIFKFFTPYLKNSITSLKLNLILPPSDCYLICSQVYSNNQN